MYVYKLDLLGVVKLANLNSYLLILASSQLKICHLHRRKMLIVYSKFSTLSKLSYRWIHKYETDLHITKRGLILLIVNAYINHFYLIHT